MFIRMFIFHAECRVIFYQRTKNIFKSGQKLEAVDLEEPYIIRVATVFNVYGRILLLLFDGHNKFQYMDYESEDIYPIGWCLKTGHPLSTSHGISKLIVELRINQLSQFIMNIQTEEGRD